MFKLFLSPCIPILVIYICKTCNGDDLSVLRDLKPERILVFMSDSRDLDLERDSTNYLAMSTALNYNYAKRHGYDFIHFVPSIDWKKIESSYQVTLPPQHNPHDPRLAISLFHPQLQQFRSISWSKLPIMWYVSSELSQKYDIALYLDSDAVITQHRENRTIIEALISWQTEKKITWGSKDLTSSSMIFFPNSPFGNYEPALGAIMFRPAKVNQLIREWWDFSDGEKAVAPSFEQDVLWKMFQWEPQTTFALNKSSTSMVSEPQFPGNESMLNRLKQSVKKWM